MDRLYIIVTICFIGIAFLLWLIKNGDKRLEKLEKESEKYSLENILEIVKFEFNNLTRSSIENMGLSEIMYRREVKKRAQLMLSLKRCIYGSVNDKEYIKDMIYDILDKKYINEKNIDYIISFNNPMILSNIDKFDIILHKFKKQYEDNAFIKLMEKYNLDKLKDIGNSKQGYVVTEEEIKEIYYNESIYLSYKDKLEIICQKIYSKYKGFSVIDEIRDMRIDGVSGGVSGVGADSMNTFFDDGYMKKIPKNYDSTWVFYKGKSIHLPFLSFGNYEELKRVCQNIYRYNNTGMLSKDIGYKVNDMIDGSRVVVVRPEFAESWAFFIRKFNSEHIDLEKLIVGKGAKHARNIIKFLARGNCITSITGAQASGKTTLLMAMVGQIYETLTLRIQEMAFELNLRKLYPSRNILSFRETTTISGQEGLDLQKKTDGSVLIIGEVATDEVAAWMIQTAQMASAFTIFTHHSKTVEDLVLALRNSLLKCDIFRNEEIAEQQVVEVLNFDIHLDRDYTGKRYISKITEIVPIREEAGLPEDFKNLKGTEAQVAFMDTMLAYFKRRVESKSYEKNEILAYENGEYILKNKISNNMAQKMKSVMMNDDRNDFEEFLNEFKSAI